MASLTVTPETAARANHAAIMRSAQAVHDASIARANKIAAREPSVIPRHTLADAIDAINDEAVADMASGHYAAANARTEIVHRLQALLD